MNYDLAAAEYLIVLMSSHIEFRSCKLHGSDSVPSREGPREARFIFAKKRSEVHIMCKCHVQEC